MRRSIGKVLVGMLALVAVTIWGYVLRYNRTQQRVYRSEVVLHADALHTELRRLLPDFNAPLVPSLSESEIRANQDCPTRGDQAEIDCCRANWRGGTPVDESKSRQD